MSHLNHQLIYDNATATATATATACPGIMILVINIHQKHRNQTWVPQSTLVIMSITITDHQLPYESHNLYDVHFYSDDIHTLVTHDPEQLAVWISEIESLNNRNLIIGLDVEWRPSFSRYQQNPVAVIQLCVDRRCLVFQILQYTSVFKTDEVPIQLKRFLGKEEYTIVGVGVASDIEKLEEDYGVHVGGKIVDLRGLAAEVYQMNRLKNAGLKELARVVLERDVEKPKRITMGRWDNPWLTPDQVKYACIDAFVSFEIGKKLNVCEHSLVAV